jgi:serine/threonine-protein kinase HipA
MNRMIKALRIQLPALLSPPNYLEDERTMLQKISDLALQQAERLEIDAKMIAKVVIE